MVGVVKVSVLYHRVLLWHKLVALVTGGLAMCSAKHRLNREEALSWVENLRNVADDISQFLEYDTFILDDRGRRVLNTPVAGCSDGGATPPADGTSPSSVVPGSSNPERSATPRKLKRKPN